MRVLLVVDSLDWGGAERHVADLAAALKRRGHDVTVACSVPGTLAESLREDGVRVEALLSALVKRRTSIRFAVALRRLLSAGRFYVVHSHIYASSAAAAVATLGSGVPLVVSEHTEAPWRTWSQQAMSWWVYRRAAHVVGVSSAIVQLLTRDYRLDESRLSFVLPVPPPAPRRPLSRAPVPPEWGGAPLVGVAARLHPEKGVDVFLRAARQVVAAFPAARFLVVGDGPLRRALEQLAEELDLGGTVRFLGFRSDAPSLIELLDVLVVPSLSDGSPFVVSEAMAAGVPVVASAVGGIPDRLHHRREGLLVPPGDPSVMAESMLELLRNPELAREMGEAGRRRSAELPFDRMVVQLEGIYQRALEPSLGRRRSWFPAGS